MASPSLLALTRALATDDETKAAFRDDPDAFLSSNGHGDLDPAELATALEHVADALPAPLAAALITAGESGAEIADLLAGVAGIDPEEAEASWASLVADDDALAVDPHDDIDGDLGPDLGDDPADLDTDDDASHLDDGDDGDPDLPGGLDRAGGADDEPRGLDPATPRTEEPTFGAGTTDLPVGDDPGRGADDDLTFPSSDDPDAPAWDTDDDRPGGLDDASDHAPGTTGDEPGGLDRHDELD